MDTHSTAKRYVRATLVSIATVAICVGPTSFQIAIVSDLKRTDISKSVPPICAATFGDVMLPAVSTLSRKVTRRVLTAFE